MKRTKILTHIFFFLPGFLDLLWCFLFNVTLCQAREYLPGVCRCVQVPVGPPCAWASGPAEVASPPASCPVDAPCSDLSGKVRVLFPWPCSPTHGGWATLRDCNIGSRAGSVPALGMGKKLASTRLPVLWTLVFPTWSSDSSVTSSPEMP